MPYEFKLTRRVEFAETDMAGIMHYSNYFRFMETAEHAFFRSLGLSIVTKVVKEVARVPVWAKLTPSTTDIVIEARGAFLGGADAITSSNTFTSLPLVDAETLEFWFVSADCRADVKAGGEP